MSTYEPYDNRVITSKSASNWEVVIHLVKSSFGIGVLHLPAAINNAGWLAAIIIGFPLVLLLIYGTQLLIKTMYKICVINEKPYISFEECAKIVTLEGPLKKMASCLKYTVRTLLLIYPFGICTVYIVYMAECFHKLYPLNSEHMYSMYLYEVILLLPVFLLNCAPNLNKMVVFSAIADLLTLFCFGALLYFIWGEEPLVSGDHEMISVEPRNIPLFFGSVLFALEAISVVLSLEEHMKTPRAYLGLCGVYNIAMIIVVSLYCLIGVSGYIKYGSNIKSSINLNLPDSLISQIVQHIFIIIIFASYPIQCYPIIVILWEDNLGLRVESRKRRIIYEYLFRFAVTLSTVIVAMICPIISTIIDLIGGICISNLAISFPAYIEFMYEQNLNQRKTYNFTMIKDIIMIIVGVAISLVAVTGTIVNVIWSKIEENENRVQDKSRQFF